MSIKVKLPSVAPRGGGAVFVPSSSAIQDVPPPSHSEEAMARERNRLGAALGTGAGRGIGTAPAGPAACLPSGGGGEVAEVELAKIVRIRVVLRGVDRLPAALVDQLVLKLFVQLPGVWVLGDLLR